MDVPPPALVAALASAVALLGCYETRQVLEGERYSCDCSVETRAPCDVGTTIDLDDLADSSLTVVCRGGTETRLVRDLQACAPALLSDVEAFCAQACSELAPDRVRGEVVSATFLEGGTAESIGPGQCASGSGGIYLFPSLTDEDVRRGLVQREFSTMDVSIDTEEIAGTASRLYVEDTPVSITGARCSDPGSSEPRCDMSIESFLVRAGFEDASAGPYASLPFTVDGAEVRNFSLRLSDQMRGRMQTAESSGAPLDDWSNLSTDGTSFDIMNLELGANIRKDGVGPMGLGTVEIDIGPAGGAGGPGETIDWPDPAGEIETYVRSGAQFMTFVGSFSDTAVEDGVEVTVGVTLDLVVDFFAGSPFVDLDFIRERRPPSMMAMGEPPAAGAVPSEPQPGQPQPGEPQRTVPVAQLADAAGTLTTLGLFGAVPHVIIDGTPSEPWPGVPIEAYRWYYRHHDPVEGSHLKLVGIGPRLQVPEHVFDVVLADPDRDFCLVIWAVDGLRSESCVGPGDEVSDAPGPLRLQCAELARALPRSLWFQEALDRWGGSLTPGGNGVTWFVPTDDAIEADIGRAAFDAILAAPDGVELERFVLSHAYEGVVPVSQVGTALVGAASLAGDPGDLSAAQKQSAIYDGDAPCMDGVVHGVEHVFVRPAP